MDRRPGDHPASYNLGKGKGPDGGEKTYSAAEVEDLIPVLRRENARGFDIYITPLDTRHHYLLVDDVRPEKLDELKANFSPCLIQSSSRDNFQAVLKVWKAEVSSAEQSAANAVLHWINMDYGDPGLQGVIHPFRMSGFANKKPGKSGFTQVIERFPGRACPAATAALESARSRRLENAKRTQEARTHLDKPDREMSPHPISVGSESGEVSNAYALEFKKMLGLARQKGWETDLSRIDYRVTQRLLIHGYGRDDVERAIVAASPGLSERHRDITDYARRTTEKALSSKEVIKAIHVRTEDQEMDMGM